MAGLNKTKIVLLGKTGSGKSSLGNTILGDDLFKEKLSPNSETDECQIESKHINGAPVEVIDTPGFFGNNMDEKKLMTEILKCMEMAAPEIHAFLIVLNVGRYTDQEKEVINKVKKLFSDEALKHAVVVFTYGDQLEEEQKIEDFIQQNPDLTELVEKCGNRCHIVDNKYWKNQQDDYRSNKFQVDQLLNMIETMKNKQGGYTNDLLQEVGKEKKGLPWGQILKVSAGVTVGILLGIFFGARIFKLRPYVGVGAGAVGGGVVGAAIAHKSKTPMEGVINTTEMIVKVGDRMLSVSCCGNNPNITGQKELKLTPE